MTDHATGPGTGTRYGRLTYTSFDSGGGAGGWQIKQRLGLTDDESTALRSRVNTQLDGGVELPRFPTPEDIAGFPRRLLYAPFGRTAAWWHVCSAGNDASGRPGNVFAHVVLDRTPGRRPTVRPIELWRSPGWLIPYGPEEVNAAQLGAGDEPPAGQPISRASVLSFLLDLETYRLGTLGALLDACAAAMAGGPRVVLVADTVDTAALWIGGLSFLMPVQYARERLSFSTLERASGLGAAFEQGVYVAAVPRVDWEAVEQLEGVVVIDEHEDVEIGDVGGQAHRTSHGFTIAATEWSAMAQVMLTDLDTADFAIEAMDGLLAEVGDPGREPGWGLAMVVSQHRDRYADAEAEAAKVILRSSPADLPEDGQLFAGASALLDDHLGRTAKDAWDRLAEQEGAGVHGGSVSQMVLGTYVLRALADVDWLTTSFDHGVPLPSGARLGNAVAEKAVEISLEVLDRLSPSSDDSEYRGRVVAALANLIARLDLTDETLDEQLNNGLMSGFIYQLFGEGADELIGRLGRFAEVTQATYIRPLVEIDDALQRDHRPGSALSPAVTFWLFPGTHPAVLATQELDLERCRLRAELAAHRLAYDPTALAERTLVVWVTLGDHRLSARDLAPYFAAPWAPEDALALRQQFAGRVRSEWLASTLKGSPPTLALKALGGRLSAGDGWNYDQLSTVRRGGVEDLAYLRYVERESWFEAGAESAHRSFDRILRGGIYAISVPYVPFDPQTLQVFTPVAIGAGVLDSGREHFARIREALAAQRRVLDVHQLKMLAAGLTGRVSWGQLGLAVMVADDRFPEPRLAQPQLSWMDTWLGPDEESALSALKVYLLDQLQPLSGDVELFKTQTVQAAQRQLYGQIDEPEKVMRAIQKFVNAWTKDLMAIRGRSSRWKALQS